MTVQTPTPAATEQPAYSLNQLLTFMAGQQASDLHLKPMRPPLIRVQGKLIPVKAEPLKPGDLEKMLLPLLNRAQREKFDANLSVDIGYGVPGVARFRANLYMQRGTVGAVFRRIPIQIQTIDQLELPLAIKDFTNVPDGLVLVTGPTGSGKSTTLAAMISYLSENEPLHIVTIEDPIEFLFQDKTAAISQREVGTDTPNFKEALKNSMRQDPDVIMVGEMRDVETMQTVLTAAESAAHTVSGSRISPMRITSGSWRSARFSAPRKSVVSAPTSRWLMIDFLSRIKNSIGSSMVMTWQVSLVLM